VHDGPELARVADDRDVAVAIGAQQRHPEPRHLVQQDR
jgi:hypothetical protein